MITLFLVATPLELPEDIDKNIKCRIIFTGMGKVNASIAATQAIHTRIFDRIINIGTCGSFNHSLTGLHQCRNFVNLDGCSDFNKECLTFDGGGTCIGSQDSFCVDPERSGHAIIKPDLVDMESFAIATVCKRFDIPFECYKYITDYVGLNSSHDWFTHAKRCHESLIGVIHDYI